jgi:hypothetical protein
MEPKRHATPERPGERSLTAQSGNMPRVAPSGNMPRVTQPTSASAEWKAAREDVLVRLMFTPGSSPLEATHAFLSTYTAERLSPSVSQRVCLAAYELLANATNYAILGSDVVLEIVERLGRVQVRASNKTIPARVTMLKQQLDKIRANPEDTFTSELKRSLTGGVSRPMLGLARIAHEAGLELELELAGDRVTVTALTR